MPVEIFEWSPRVPISNIRGLRRFSRRSKVVNFGDALGSIVAKGVARRRGTSLEASRDWRLLVVGSILHLTQPGDVVWGPGINGKAATPISVSPGEIDIRAVRGPRTHAVLTSKGFQVPQVFGDPALLLPTVDKRFALRDAPKTRRLAVIPNLNDLPNFLSHPNLVSPLNDPVAVATEIASSELVVGSSLHAMILADALGVESRLVKSEHEHPFKYYDYYEGTDREAPRFSSTLDEALRSRGPDALRFDLQALESAFPADRFLDADDV